MKLYQKYKQIVEEIKPLEVAWFTTFNLDPELVEKFLVSCFVGTEPSQLKTAEDYEALNSELANIDIKLWYDYRAINLQSNKRTSIDLIPVDPTVIRKAKNSKAIFHPKVIFLKGEKGAYLITGSANLSISAWSSNLESVIIKKINNESIALEILGFFKSLGAEERKLINWAKTLPKDKTDWRFIHSINGDFNLFDHLTKGDLTIWSPYFSKKTNKFLNSIIQLGYDNIKLVPNLSDAAKIHIQHSELELLKESDSICIYKPKELNQDQGLHHAKVWLTENSLAIGSWNCSKRATGLNISSAEKNIEAGVVANLSQIDAEGLYDKIIPIESMYINGLSEEEIDEQWKLVLNDFKLSLQIVADWNNFTYSFDNVDGLKNEYKVSLPHNPTVKVPLNEIDGLSFRERFVRVLKNKSFTVYDKGNKAVYQGFLLEKGKEKRPVYSYVSLSDLLEALLDDPTGSTTRKKCSYKLSAEDVNITESIEFDYEGSNSYYYMFVSFQKMVDKIEDIANNEIELDKLGFRLPGSLLNIKFLVTESIEKALQEKNEDDLLFHYFLIEETNRCIATFNNYSENSIDAISDKYWQNLRKVIKFSKKDIKFLKKLKKEYEYEFV